MLQCLEHMNKFPLQMWLHVWTFRWENYPEYPAGPSQITWVHESREPFAAMARECICERKVKEMWHEKTWLTTAGFEDVPWFVYLFTYWWAPWFLCSLSFPTSTQLHLPNEPLFSPLQFPTPPGSIAHSLLYALTVLGAVISWCLQTAYIFYMLLQTVSSLKPGTIDNSFVYPRAQHHACVIIGILLNVDGRIKA